MESETNTADGTTDDANVGIDSPPTTPQFSRGVPTSDDFEGLVDMYSAWAGLDNSGPPLKDLFCNSKWRAMYCKKNSAELKRMQRISYICKPVEKFLQGSNVELSQEVKKFEDLVFNGKVPETFSWTRYEKAMKQHARST